MKYEVSAGVVVFFNNDHTLFYLILQYGAGHWDLPKGHIEKNETPSQAALREVKEETGLDIQLEEGFEQQYEYFFKDQDNILVQKKVIFFIGKAKTQDITLSSEHLAYKWLPFAEASHQSTYTNTRQLLQLADQWIHSHCSKK